MDKDKIIEFIKKNQNSLPVLTTFWEINSIQTEKSPIIQFKSKYYNDFELKLRPYYKPIAKLAIKNFPESDD